MLRLVNTMENDDLTKRAKVYWNSEEREYRVCFHQDGRYLTKADYFTDALVDAVGTVNQWLASRCV
jgi:hypothetical protein